MSERENEGKKRERMSLSLSTLSQCLPSMFDGPRRTLNSCVTALAVLCLRGRRWVEGLCGGEVERERKSWGGGNIQGMPSEEVLSLWQRSSECLSCSSEVTVLLAPLLAACNPRLKKALPLSLLFNCDSPPSLPPHPSSLWWSPVVLQCLLGRQTPSAVPLDNTHPAYPPSSACLPVLVQAFLTSPVLDYPQT